MLILLFFIRNRILEHIGYLYFNIGKIQHINYLK